jgi:hypothetical protein
MSRSVPAFGAFAAVLMVAVPLEPTYYRDVIPILEKHCYDCHRPGGPAMSLANYHDAKRWARPMRDAVLSTRMPPQHPESLLRHMQETRSLTREEIQTIVRWVETGTQEGSPQDAPPRTIIAHL